MTEFFQEHLKAIYYIIAVLICVTVLQVITQLAHKWLVKREQLKHPDKEPNTLHLLRRILKILWYILGLSAISVVFIEEQYRDRAKSDFWLIFYLGIVITFTVIGVAVVQNLFSKAIIKKVEEREDPTSYKFLRNLAVFGVYFVGLVLGIYAFPQLRGIAQTAVGGAGVLAVVVGLASQEAFANLVGGVFIITFKPFKINDIIKVSDVMVGTVTDITLRHTIIRNYENKMIVIPNAIINKEKLINYDLGDRRCCQWIEIGISYDSDIDIAKDIMKKECTAHPNLIDNRTSLEIKNGDPKVLVRVTALNESEVTLRAWAWSWDYSSGFVMKCDLLESIKKRFDAEGIEIPFPHRTMVFKEKQLKELKEQLS
ncbi:mechanosensitive ion channel family protein [Cellulophaga sp. HaHaR_3_176]|uniref:mechanosensitive ion channel family protein n=1 Tax=Cellulophaga sp. HaHaR_3_176 TaxID=1942464 RepID=UPI001C1FEFCF|nr:mechanosensitive ion channel family protein [Cellulophaga sp. HaHaR_3_176]QWX85154.1 mechanosensitive ion channel family protein [Cellulophaga sp. HaHaR_3_176]